MVNKIVVIVLAIAVLLGAALFLSGVIAPSMPNATAYSIQPEFIPGSVGDYAAQSVSEVKGNAFEPNAGVLYTISATLLNTVNTTRKEVPMNMYSVVKICNTSESAQAAFSAYSSRVQRYTNSTALNVSRIGDMSDGAMVVYADQNQTLFVLQFSYKNVYARVGSYEPLGSKSAFITAKVADELLASIQNAQG